MIEDIKVRKIKQNFNRTKIDNLSEYIHQSFKKSDLKNRIKSGDKIGITVGSRGITNIKLIVKEIISELKNLNALPFILPAMGSHGGATSEGQKGVLASYGITQKEMGVPIMASMDVIQIGKVENKIPIYFSKVAMEADGVIAINRVKMHTDFKSNLVESGMSKILAIGLGKAMGASSIHFLGVYGLKNIIPQGKFNAHPMSEAADVDPVDSLIVGLFSSTGSSHFSKRAKLLFDDTISWSECYLCLELPVLPMS